MINRIDEIKEKRKIAVEVHQTSATRVSVIFVSVSLALIVFILTKIPIDNWQVILSIVCLSLVIVFNMLSLIIHQIDSSDAIGSYNRELKYLEKNDVIAADKEEFKRTNYNKMVDHIIYGGLWIQLGLFLCGVACLTIYLL